MENQSLSMDEVTQIIGTMQLNLTVMQKRIAILERENSELKRKLGEVEGETTKLPGSEPGKGSGPIPGPRIVGGPKEPKPKTS